MEILWAHKDYADELEAELKFRQTPVIDRKDSMFLINESAHEFVWAESRGRKSEVLEFASISEAQKALRERGKLWAPSPASAFRRSQLIAEGLLSPRQKKWTQGSTLPKGTLGSFSLIGENKMWVSSQVEPAIPPGALEFEENLEAPSRAYLKLWELFLRMGHAGPQKNERVLEVGSAPGGWTWVLSNLGCEVTCVDKGKMDSAILARSNVTWEKRDAFSEQLYRELKPVDWFFSDLICYPQDLLQLVQNLRAQNFARNFVCTIKFQGPTDFAAVDQFLKIEGSKAKHLSVNKHEVTWWLLREEKG